MSYTQELRDRLKAIKLAERQTKDTRTANEARHEAWGQYIEHVYQLNPMGAASSYPGEAS